MQAAQSFDRFLSFLLAFPERTACRVSHVHVAWPPLGLVLRTLRGSNVHAPWQRVQAWWQRALV